MAEKKSLEKYLAKIFFDKYKMQFFNFQICNNIYKDSRYYCQQNITVYF